MANIPAYTDILLMIFIVTKTVLLILCVLFLS